MSVSYRITNCGSTEGDVLEVCYGHSVDPNEERQTSIKLARGESTELSGAGEYPAWVRLVGHHGDGTRYGAVDVVAVKPEEAPP